MRPPELIGATQAQLDELLAQAKPSFSAQQYVLLEGVLGTFSYVMLALQNAKTSIKRFRKMLFGASTESRANVLGVNRLKDNELTTQSAAPADHDSENEVPSAKSDCEGGPSPTPAKVPVAANKPKAGHGRNGAKAYANAPVIQVEVAGLRAGELCPDCNQGKVYGCPPRTLVKVIGQPPLVATVYKLAQLRCHLCDAIFTGPMPAGVGSPKYDPSCASMLALLRYGCGMPFYRLEALQGSLNVPLPDATQWEIVAKAVPGPRAAFEALIGQAAQGQLLHNDDTPARILELIHQRAKLEAAGQSPSVKAINTSGIVAQCQERKMVLFFTGHAHAGQNLAKVLAYRVSELAPPMQMCDALAANVCPELDTILSHCLSHGRRKFVEVIEHFPTECAYVIEVLAQYC